MPVFAYHEALWLKPHQSSDLDCSSIRMERLGVGYLWKTVHENHPGLTGNKVENCANLVRSSMLTKRVTVTIFVTDKSSYFRDK